MVMRLEKYHYAQTTRAHSAQDLPVNLNKAMAVNKEESGGWPREEEMVKHP